MGRIIGIRARRKQTKEGEARPTMVAIKTADGSLVTHELATDTDELDFVYELFPIAWRNVNPGEPLDPFRPHHCKWRKLNKKERAEWDPKDPHLRKNVKGDLEVCVKVPVRYEGLKPGDRVAMLLGGSGDRFAGALSARGEKLDPPATVHRIPPFTVKQLRGETLKEEDHLTVIQLFETQPGLFYRTLRRHRDIIRVREALLWRQDAMKARIACGQRLEGRHVGRIFLSEAGGYPEGRIEDEFDALRANDTTYQALIKQEEAREREVEKAVEVLDVWQEIFRPIEGCGYRIAAGLIAAIGILPRFTVQPDFTGATTERERVLRKRKARHQSESRLKAYCGVHVLHGGKYANVPPEQSFPRNRRDRVSNWVDLARQSLFLLVDQFNKRPESHWGIRLRKFKAQYRANHPDVVLVERLVDGKKKMVQKFNDGHIHQTGLWRSASRFIEWLYGRWMQLEAAAAAEPESQEGDEPEALAG